MLVRTAPGLLVAGMLAGCALLVPGSASPLAVALVAGMLVARTGPRAATLTPGRRVAARAVLRLGGVLLGLSVTADAVLSLGWQVLALVLTAVALTLLVVVCLGAALGVRRPAALLIAAGFAMSELRRLGLRPLALGLVSWVLLAGGALLGVKAVAG